MTTNETRLNPDNVVRRVTRMRCLSSVWRYQRGNQNPYIEEEQTTQWPKEIVQKEKQRSTKHAYETKDTDFTRFENEYTDRKSVGG
jgi:hypothetical protein